FELRKNKGVSLDDAKKMLKNELYFGTMMLHCNDADGLIGGASHSTSETVRAAFQIIKTKKDVKKVSGAMIMIKDEKVLLFADCAVIPNPSSDELAEIAMLSIKTFEALFDKKAKAGMLSYSTTGSGNGEDVDRVKKAVKIAKKCGLNVVGEIQADAALIEDVCEKKCPQINCGENINVLVFPSLNSGNISYKLVERLGGLRAIGPILQGLKKPMNDLSRGCSVEDIVDLAAITVVQAQKRD
ncbi:phosphate acetyltransferase, partial [Candidatus Woesearchaeota archaeon]|nr:phosphate acetyltransferase [Candidatus Woesearchaeota archaeon]